KRAHRVVVANVHHPLDIDVANGLRHVPSLAGKVQRIAWYPWHMQHVVARRLDALISGSRASAQLVERLWRLPPGLMHPIYDGVDTTVFHPGAADEMCPGALPELVVDDDTGRIVPAGNAEGLAEAIEELLGAPERCRAMGAAGRARALQRFTWTQCAADTDALYRQTIAAKLDARTQHVLR